MPQLESLQPSSYSSILGNNLSYSTGCYRWALGLPSPHLASTHLRLGSNLSSRLSIQLVLSARQRSSSGHEPRHLVIGFGGSFPRGGSRPLMLLLALGRSSTTELPKSTHTTRHSWTPCSRCSRLCPFRAPSSPFPEWEEEEEEEVVVVKEEEKEAEEAEEEE